MMSKALSISHILWLCALKESLSLTFLCDKICIVHAESDCTDSSVCMDSR